MSNNPLAGYFRRPAIYIPLPSNGKYYPPGTLEMTENREFPVYPMTASDEIAYRTPDALFNGQAIVDVIQSCIPNIKNAWVVPTLDLDTILVSIRIASFGHEMEIDTTCPNCEEEAKYGLDLRIIIDQMKRPDYDQPLTLGDMQIMFKPMNYKQVTENNQIQFEEKKVFSIVADNEFSEEQKLKLLQDAFKKVSQLTLTAVQDGINYVQTPETTVTEPEHIMEFLRNCDRKVFNRLKNHIIDMKSDSELKPLDMKCNHCKHEYKQPFTFDVSNFFD